MEIWKSVREYPHYEISTDGTLRRIAPVQSSAVGIILKPHLTRYGYYRYCLSGHSTGRKRYKSVASLVLETFVSPRPEGMQINHRDGNKLNNNLENLEWVTASENQKHATRLGLHRTRYGCEHNRAVFNKDEISGIRWWYDHGLTTEEIGRIFHVQRTTIGDIVKYRTYVND